MKIPESRFPTLISELRNTQSNDLDETNTVDIEQIEDTINGLVAHYRRELDRYASEMIENGMPTSIICKDLKTYMQDIGE